MCEASRQLRKSPEGMDGTNGGEGFLGQRTGLAVDIEHGIFVYGVIDDADNGDDDVDGNNRDENESQFPLDGKGDGECGDEAGECLHSKTKLFRDAIVDEIAVGSELTGDGGRRGIKEGNLLAKGLTDELDTQGLGRSDGGDGEKDLRTRLAQMGEDYEETLEQSVTYCPNIRQDKLANENVDEEKTGSNSEQTGSHQTSAGW